MRSKYFIRYRYYHEPLYLNLEILIQIYRAHKKCKIQGNIYLITLFIRIKKVEWQNYIIYTKLL